MPKPKTRKPKPRAKNSVKVTVDVHPSVVRALDAEAERLRKEWPDGNWSRSERIRTSLARSFGKRISKKDRAALYEELRRKAVFMKLRGQNCLTDRKVADARDAYLQAASLELEALALLDNPDEATVLAALIGILALLKEGTGYMHLPEVPGGRRTVRSLQ